MVLVSEIYPDNIIVLPLENRPVFPGLALPLAFVSEKIVGYVKHAIEKNNGFIGVSLIEKPDTEQFLNSKLYATGTLLKIIKVINQTEESISIVAQALTRFTHIKDVIRNNMPHWQVLYHYEEKAEITSELKAYTLAIINSVKD